MTDRELLEKAAKAAGLGEVWYLTDDSQTPYIGPRFKLGHPVAYRVWNPLTDDGDALRLAVKVLTPYDIELVWIEAQEADDLYAATRRAIVRAAAAMAPQER